MRPWARDQRQAWALTIRWADSIPDATPEPHLATWGESATQLPVQFAAVRKTVTDVRCSHTTNFGAGPLRVSSRALPTVANSRGRGMDAMGAILKATREAAGLSLQAMARRAHYSKGYLSNVEAGKRRATPEIVAAYDRALGDDVDRRELLLGLMAGVVSTLERAATAANRDDRRRHVLRLLGQTHQAMGETAFDQLKLTEAARHFRAARDLGVESGDPDMTAMALVQLGDIGRRRQAYGSALRLLDASDHHAAAAGLLTQVWRWQTLARAYAEMGERSPFERAIDRAEQLAERISAEYHQEGDHSPRGVRLERGHGLTLLGDPAAALAIYDLCFPPTFHSERERGSFTIIRAQALAHAGHLDEGVRLAIEGINLARGYHSPRHLSRVQRMHDRLAAVWPRTEPRLLELREALAAP